MLVLGIHGGQARESEDQGPGFGSHDAAAVVVREGAILAAIEEERISRLKHSNAFPVEAIRFCLDQAGTGWEEVDWIALVRRLGRDTQANDGFTIECTANDFFCESRVHLSNHLFRALLAADGRRSTADLLKDAGLPEDQWERVTEELVDLWTRRVVFLRPPAA